MAITYSEPALYRHYDAQGKLRSVSVTQTATAAAGGETILYLPGGATAADQLKSMLRNKLVRIRKLLLDSTLTVPIQCDLYMYRMRGGYVSRAETFDLGVKEAYGIEMTEAIYDLNFEAYTGGAGGTPFVLHTDALTLADLIVMYLDLEVVE